MKDVILCPSCGNRSKILGGRGMYKTLDDGTKSRMRECRTCGERWRTYELSQEVYDDLASGYHKSVRQLEKQLTEQKQRRIRDLKTMMRVMNKYYERDIEVKRAMVIIHSKAEQEGLL